jgi:PleD family two-component response regulator
MSDRNGGAAPAPGTVLVVDDSRMNRATLARLLERLGHAVVQAENGREALEAMRDDARRVDVVLLDLIMPELDGFATLEAMKADPVLATIPVIVVSGLDDLDSIVRCIEMGATDFLPRPIKPALLRARVGASLADKRLRDENANLLAAGRGARLKPGR